MRSPAPAFADAPLTITAMQRRTLLKALAAAGVLPIAAGAAAATASGSWRDVLDTPAQRRAARPERLLNGLARAGKRIVAVGQRGHVLVSDDAGKSWQQADVPVSADLVAVCFANADTVGRSGMMASCCTAPTPAGRGSGSSTAADRRAPRRLLHQEAATPWLAEAQRFAAQGADNPFLDVWFDDATNGYRRRRVRSRVAYADGGTTWQPLLHAIDNPKGAASLRGAAHRRRCLHRRRAGPAAEARSATARASRR